MSNQTMVVIRDHKRVLSKSGKAKGAIVLAILKHATENFFKTKLNFFCEYGCKLHGCTDVLKQD